ncbi:unnamed protein product, partial [Urochloa humidicola]
MGVKPSVEQFLRTHIVQPQPKKVTRGGPDGRPVTENLQFGCINFKYKDDVDYPATAYKKRWEDFWVNYWFYHTIEVDEQTQTDPLVCKEFGDIAEEFNCNVEDSEENRLFLVAFDALANEYSVRDLVEEF